MSTVERKQMIVRLTEAERAAIAAAARRNGLTINKYVLRAALAEDRNERLAEAVNVQIETLLTARLAAQTDAVVGALSQIAAQHDEQDRELREGIKTALNKVLVSVRKGAGK